jgi:hypothetical protein
MPEDALEFWEVWYPEATATGMLVGRGRLQHTDVLLVHAAPDVITVEVSTTEGRRLAYGRNLERTRRSPICRLSRSGEAVTREDVLPAQADLGLPVLLPGGEVGILRAWWNAEDEKEWRWQIELYNSIR